MAFNRELSQFANYLELDAGAKYISIAADSNAEVGIGTAATEAKLTVGGDVFVTGVVTATNFIGSFTGNADTASALQTSRTIALGGDLSGSVSFDGASDVTIVGTVNPNSVDLGTDTVGNYVATLGDAGLGNLVVSGSGSETASVTLDLSDTGVGANTYGATGQLPVITVDAKGRITSATTTDVATSLSVEGDSGSASVDLLAEKMDFDGGSNITSSVATIPSQIYPVLSSTNNDADLSSPLTFQKVSGSGSGFINAISTIQTETTGKYYAEFTLDNFSSFGFIGIGVRNNLASGNISKGRDYSQIGRWEDEYGLYPNSYTDIRFYHNNDHPTSNVGDNQAGFEAVQVGDVIGLLLDLDNSTLSFSKNGVVGNNISIASGLNYQIGVSVFKESQTVTVNFGESAFLHLPEGYTGLSGESPDGGGASVTFALDPDISLTSVTASGTLSADGVVSGSEFHTGAEGSSIRVTSNTISGPATITLDPAGVGDNTGKVIIAGDLQVDGTQTIVNSTTVAIDDLNIQVASEAADDGEANGAGFTVNSGEGNKTFQFEAIGDNFGSSENLNLASDKTFKIENIDVLSSDTLGVGVTNSSLTSVGVLENLTVTGVVTSVAGFDGSFLGNLDGEARIAQAFSTARNFSASGDATAPQVLFDGTDDVDLNLTLANTGVVAGTYGTTIQIPKIVVDSKGRITSITEVTGDLLEKAGGVMSGILEVGQVDNPPVEVLVHENGERIGDFNSAAATVTETTGSVYFDGTGDYLDVGSSSDYQFGTGDFTVEMIVYANDFVRRGTFFDGRNSADSIGLTIGHEASTGEIKVYMNATSGGDIVVQSSNFATQTWTHIAVTRESGTVRLFIDGVLEDSATRTSDLNSVTINRLGYKTHTISSYDYFYGYMSNARIVKGTAVYTEDFTVPTEQLTAIAGTVLLCCQSTTDAAAEETGKTITVNGDAVASTETPGLTYERNPFGSFNGLTGSVAFDGSGDFLSIPNSSDLQFGSGDFTIEGWFYLNSLGRDQAIVNKWDSGNSEWNVKINGENQLILRINIGGGSIDIKDSESVSASTWYHFAIVRDGNTFKIFKNGQLREDKNLSVTIPSVNADVKIGQILNLDYFDGYISNLRLVKGNAVYTEDFTPPTEELTAVGNATATSSSASVYFDGSSALDVESNSDLALGTENFTLEFWAYSTATHDALDAVFDTRSSTAGSDGFIVGRFHTSASNTYSLYTGGGFRLTATDPVENNVWAHIAIVRLDGTTSLYVNGVAQQSFADGYSYSNTAAAIASTIVTANMFTGNISNLRLVKGTAVYTDNFTVPTEELTAISGTVLLCCQSDTDPTAEATGKSITDVAGTPTGSTVAPFTIAASGTASLLCCQSTTDPTAESTGKSITANGDVAASTVSPGLTTTYIVDGADGNVWIEVEGSVADSTPGYLKVSKSSDSPDAIATYYTFDTITGEEYDVTIDIDPRVGTHIVKTLFMDGEGVDVSKSLSEVQWTEGEGRLVKTYAFTANSGKTTIAFGDGTQNNTEFHVHDISVLHTETSAGAQLKPTGEASFTATVTAPAFVGNLTGNVVGNVTGNLTGNADTATRLQTARTIAVAGAVAGNASFDGTGNITLNTTQQANTVELATHTTGDYVETFSGTAGNISVTGASGERSTPSIDLVDHGPGAATYGTSSAYPIITLDEKGRVTNVTTDNTIYNNLNIERQARIDNDALKLDLAGGTMSGNLEVGQISSAPVEALVHTTNGPISRIGDRIGDFNYGDDANIWTKNGSGAQAYATVGGDLVVTKTSNSSYGIGAWYAFDTIAGTEYTAVVDLDPKQNTNTVTTYFFDGDGINFPQIALETWSEGDGRQTKTFTFTAESARTTIAFGDATQFTRSFSVYDISVTYAPSTAGALIGTDGTAAFSGNLTAATAPVAAAHLTNKQYVDGLNAARAADITANLESIAAEESARISADTTLQTNITAEETARIANDALKLDLAGGTMTGAIEMGAAVSGTAHTWDTSKVDTSGGGTVTFTNDNKTFSSTAAWDGTVATPVIPTSGKYYWELQSTDTRMLFSISTTAEPAAYAADSVMENIYAFRPGASRVTYGSSSETFEIGFQNIADPIIIDIANNGLTANFGIAYDADAGNLSLYINGTFIWTIPNVPAYDYYFHISPEVSNTAITVAFAESDWSQTPPNGFVSLDQTSVSSSATIGVDGTASFSGLISAATAPIADEHLTNKLYVDQKAAVNAAAIEAVVGGAPDLLNTLNELSDAISDDENFSATVAGNIAAERTARIDADTVLQSNIDSEAATRLGADGVLQSNIDSEAATRIANDALKLDLAGGTMSGAINLGTGEMDLSTINPRGSTPVSGTHDNVWDGNLSTFVEINHAYNATVFDDMTVTSTLRIYAQTTRTNSRIVLNSLGSNNGSLNQKYNIFVTTTAQWIDIPVTGTVRSIGFYDGGSYLNYIKLYAVEIDGVVVTGTSTGLAVLGVDGTATFSGLVSAATEPVAAAHLTNKQYVDGLNAARVAATDVLTADLATEVAARKANDDLKLDLAGGTMSGAINVGSVGAPGTVSEVVLDGQKTYIIDRGVDFENTHLDFAGSDFTSVDFNFHTDGTVWYGGSLTPDDFNQNLTNKDSFSVENSRYLKTKFSFNGSVTLSADSNNGSNLITVYELNVTAPSGANINWIEGNDLLATYVIGVPSAGTTINTDGTASFSGAISAAGGTMSGDLDMGSNKITYSNVYSTEADLPSASNYHGMFAHVHATGSGYYAHAGQWIKLETAADSAAADALKLDLAGGTMSGAIQLGQGISQQAYVPNVSISEGSSLSNGGGITDEGMFTVNYSESRTGIKGDGTITFNPIPVTEKFWIEHFGSATAEGVTFVINGVDTGYPTGNGLARIPFVGDVTSISLAGATSDQELYIWAVSADTQLESDHRSRMITTNSQITVSSPVTTIGVDGTSTFGGLVSAPTAAISDNLELSGTITDSASSTGNSGYVLKSTGDSVEWIDILSILPQTRTTQSFTATTAQTNFQFEYNVNYLDVFVNGVRLTATEYIATDGFDITIKEPLFAGDKVEFVSYAVQGSGTGTVSSSNDLTDITLSGPQNNDILVYDGAQFVNQQTLSLSGSIQAAAFSGDGANLTSLNASNLATGTITAERLGVSGTRNNTTFLRGDNTWAVVDSTTLLDTNGAVRVASTVTGADVTGNLNVSGAMSGEITPVDGSANGWHRVAFVNASGTSDVLKDGSFSYNPSSKRLSVGGVISGDKVTSYYDINVASGGVNAAGIVTCTGLDVTGNSTITGNIVPTADNTYDLGSPTASWKDVYIGPGSLYVNGQKVIEENSQNIVVSADENQNLVLETTGSGDIELNPVGTGVVQVKGTLLVQDGTNIMNSNGNDVVFSSNVAVDNLVSRTEGSDLTLSGRGSGGVRVSDSLLVNGAIEAASMEINTGDLTVEGGVEATTLNAGGTGGIIISNNTIVGPSSITIDPATVGDATGDVYILGNLQVEGTTTTVNSVELAIADKNITVAKDADSAAAADGAGMTVAGANATFNYSASADSWVANKDVKSEGTVTATNFNTTSDVNLKENIRPVEGASELVSNLEGVHYTWKSNGEETLGVIAQQIEEHLPQLVQTSGTYKTVNYNGLIGVLIEAVKEQGSQINALKAEIEELKK